MEYIFYKTSAEYIFYKTMHDWEVDLVSSFFELLYSIRLRQDSDDIVCWIPSKRRKFEVRSFYHVVCSC